MNFCICVRTSSGSELATWHGNLLICDRCNRSRMHAVEPDENQKKRSWINKGMISTTSSIAGYAVKEQFGVVVELSSASGWTASSKGNSALSQAFAGLVKSAIDLGANAIVSVSFTSFGAGGGITSIVGGDAVGILITGTAVYVEKILDNETSTEG
jgi:uncharacterized protein YbjQ (UPF0145 family)